MSGKLVGMLRFPNELVFEVAEASLLEERTDAIVNAANGHLAHGGGVAAAIARAAGAAMIEEDQRIVKACGAIPTGEAVVSVAGKLPFKAVIHAIGPYWGQGDEQAKLTSALTAAFQCAHVRGLNSVSFPAVSSGIFAVPLEICARAYVAAVRQFCAATPESSVKLIRLCLFPGPLIDLMKVELERD